MRTRDKNAALRLMKASKRHGTPERITPDGLRSLIDRRRYKHRRSATLAA
jgi:transposase-like protein